MLLDWGHRAKPLRVKRREESNNVIIIRIIIRRRESIQKEEVRCSSS
jgi:hypothetical protein